MRTITVAPVTPTEAGPEWIRELDAEIARMPATSLQHQALSAAIQIQARKYCKAFDAEQATATRSSSRRIVASN